MGPSRLGSPSRPVLVIPLALVLVLATVVVNAHQLAASTTSNAASVAPKAGADQYRFTDTDPGIVVDGSDLWVQTAWYQATTGQTSPTACPNPCKTGWRRFKGPDIDHLVQQQDAQMDSSFLTAQSGLSGFSGWWSSGIWRDSSTGTWYSPMHTEYSETYGDSGAHTRKIVLGKSTDKGATWTLVGDIITADSSRGGSPGSDWIDFGDGDPKLFVDTTGGYFYLYYMDGWMNTKQFGLSGQTMKVARCQISATDVSGNHMYPGCWHKWYGSAWTQAGLGGLDTPLWASSFNVRSEPIVFYDSYLSSFVALASGWQATASDLGTQNWTAQDFCFPVNNLWYMWPFDTSTSNRYSVGQTFRLYSSRTTSFGQYLPITLSSGFRTSCSNLVANPGFEAGSLSSWTSTGTAIADPANANSGSYAAKVTGVNSSVSQTVSGLSPGTTYRVQAYADLINAGDQASIAVSSYGGSTITSTVTWTNYLNGHSLVIEGPSVNLTFTTGATNTSATISFTKTSGSGSAYVDDVALSRESPVDDSSLESWWRLDEGSGTATSDATGTGNAGALHGGATWVQGLLGNALNFNGTDGYLSAGVTNMPAANQPQTISWWMNVSSFSTGTAIAVTSTANSSGVLAGIPSSGNVGVWQFGGTSLVSATAPSVNAWHHYAYTFDGTTHRLYIDGVSVATSTVTAQTAAPSELNVGRSTAATSYLAGKLDDVRIYSRALTASDIQRLAAGLVGDWNFDDGGTITNAGANLSALDPSHLAADGSNNGNIGSLSISESSLQAYWRADELTSTPTLVDASGNANNGSLLAREPNLLGYWQANDNSGSTLSDASANANNGTLNGGVSWAGGQFGGGLSFNGSTGYVAASASGMPAANQAQSFSWWMYVTSYSPGCAICLTNDGSSSGVQAGIPTTGVVGVWKYGGTVLVSTTAPSANAWHHYAYTFDGTTHRLYVDGTLAATTTSTSNSASPAELNFGRWAGGSDYLSGRLDDLRIYSAALSASEVAQIASSITGGVTRGYGQFARDLVFDGTTGYVSAGVTNLPAANQAQSFSWWMNVPSYSPGCAICLTNDASSSGVQAGISSPGVVGVWKYGGTSLVSATAPSTNAWHHYAYTFDGTTHRLYIDGSLATSSTVTPNAASPAELNIGRWAGGLSYLSGQLDDLRIYSVAIPSTEVAVIAASHAGGVSWAQGVFGSAAVFDGTTGYISAAVSDLPAANQAQSFSWWMKVSSYTPGCAICLSNNASSSAVQAGIPTTGNVGVWKYGGTVLVSAAAPSANAWHHYAYTFDGTTHRIYIDGTQVATSTTAPNTASPAELNFGRWAGGNTNLSGYLDAVQIYNRALSASEVTNLSLAGGLMGRWTFDEGSGSTTSDTTGIGGTGSLNGAGIGWTSSGAFGSAITFDGSTAYISALPNDIDGSLYALQMPAANQAQSFSWWMKVSSYSSGCAICLTNNGSSSGVQAGIPTTGTVGVWKYGGTVLVSATAPSVNVWHHYVYTFDGTTHRLYIDGTLANSATTAPNGAAPVDLNFGRWSGGSNYLNGQLDAIRIYTRTLSSGEVTALVTQQ